ncbi:MAG: fimbrillin family protein [Bacteroidales bacterium]|nr:fimbrillin family protein [Bacteroidales bacterium]
MSRLRYIALITVLIALSCSKENNLSINESVLRISPATQNQTKSLVDDTNIETKEIGIQITDPSGNGFYASNSEFGNIKLVKPVDQSWITEDGEGLKKDVVLTNDYAKIYAYYPFIPANVTGVGESAYMALDIPRQFTSGYVEDYLWGAQATTTPGGASSINATNSSVQLKLNHSLTLVAFIIYKDGYEGAGTITKMDLICKSGNIFRVNKESSNDLNMRLTNGEITGGDLISTITITDINSTILESDPGTNQDTLLKYSNIQTLLVPTSFPKKEDLEFSIEVDGNIYTVSLAGTDPMQLVEGNAYIIKAKLNPRMLNIVGVQDWSRVEYEVSSGYDDLWFGIPPVEIAGLLWAPVNMGYDPISNPYGLFYQWHRKYGQKSTCSKTAGPVTLAEGNSIQNSNTFYTISSTPYYWYAPPDDVWSTLPQYNPCPDGWRVPSNSEILALISAGSTWVNAGAGGMNDMAGRWFGGSHSTNHSGSVFIPASGRITPTGLFQAPGAYCMMWIADKVSGEYKNLLFTDASVASQSSYIGNGLSVRCVKDL